MPRRPREGTAERVFHVLNRAVQGLVPFSEEEACEAYIGTLCETMDRFPMRILAYALMPNHWHLVLWPPTDDSLAPFMKYLTAAHARSWRRTTDTRGRGAVYQGRYKAIAVQTDRHLLQVCRYVERNPLRARLVAKAEDWPWTSAAPEARGPNRPTLTPWPVPQPSDWRDRLNVPESSGELEHVRSAIRRGRHFGSPSWRLRTSEELNWRSGARGPGRLSSSEATDVEELPSSNRTTELSVSGDVVNN